MTTEANPHSPAILHRQTKALSVAQWTVPSATGQKTALQTFATILEHMPWPKGLLASTLLLSVDGSSLLNIGQWDNDPDCDSYVEGGHRSIARQLDRVVAWIAGTQAARYFLYRAGVRDRITIPGCAVLVSVKFDGPDESRQREWVDNVFEAIGAAASPPSGGLSAHFLLSSDGTRVLNYAEWTDAESHQEAITASQQGGGFAGPEWTKVHNQNGIKASGFQRYRLGVTLLPEEGRGQRG